MCLSVMSKRRSYVGNIFRIERTILCLKVNVLSYCIMKYTKNFKNKGDCNGPITSIFHKCYNFGSNWKRVTVLKNVKVKINIKLIFLLVYLGQCILLAFRVFLKFGFVKTALWDQWDHLVLPVFNDGLYNPYFILFLLVYIKKKRTKKKFKFCF